MQRWTGLARLIVHQDGDDTLIALPIQVREGLAIGNSLEEGTLVGPAIDQGAITFMATANALGGAPHGDGRRQTKADASLAVIAVPIQTPVRRPGAFAPIRSAVNHSDLRDASAIQNAGSGGQFTDISSRDGRNSDPTWFAQTSNCAIACVGLNRGSDTWRDANVSQTGTASRLGALLLAQGVFLGI